MAHAPGAAGVRLALRGEAPFGITFGEVEKTVYGPYQAMVTPNDLQTGPPAVPENPEMPWISIEFVGEVPGHESTGPLSSEAKDALNALGYL